MLWFSVLWFCDAVRVFKTRVFGKFAQRKRITDTQLSDVVHRFERGEAFVDLGGGVFKCRVARPGAGRSSGYRFLIFCRKEERLIFAFGFAKNERRNISEEEDRKLHRLCDELLKASDLQIEGSCRTGALKEVEFNA